MKIISPSLLAADFTNLAIDLERLNNTNCEWLHLDVMDGNFVPNISFGYQLIDQIKSKSNKFFDVHLMMTNPQNYLEEFINAGADLITFHIEIDYDISKLIFDIKQKGLKVGLAINPDTNVESLMPYLQDLDLVLPMSVNPGFGGQTFIEDTVEKIEWLKDYRMNNNLKYWIEVDGGINDKTIDKVVNADVIVSGSYLFNGDMQSKINVLRGE